MSHSYVTNYDDIAATLAAVAKSLESYSIIDKLANALSPDAVNRGIYEMSRNLDAMVKSTGDNYIQQIEDKGKPFIKIYIGKEMCFSIPGKLADPSKILQFLEESYKDIHIARSVASYAMYLAANSKLENLNKK
ncbi:MAG: hypothetical protein QXM93_06500 [Candidatus Methanomethyliaceae archaeon]